MPGKRASLPQSGPRHVLVVNCGSATLKYKLFAAADGETLHPIAAATLPIAAADPAALATLVDSLPRRPDVVAHRVVYGDEQFNELAVIDDQVLSELEALAELAPLHHERATVLIRAAAGLGLPQVAAFDSAFHRTMPAVARRYALPPLEGVQRHGFHGWSHRFAVEEYARLTGHADPTLVTLHLGGGCSAAAIRHGRSVDTSMGFTPLEGLVMGTRAGDLDPGLLLHLLRTGFTADQLEDLLQHHSGLRGLAGTSDMRELLRRHDAEAVLAVDVFCHRVRKYVGAYLAVLEGAEAIVFTGAIGEGAPEIRRRVCAGFAWAGLTLDLDRNAIGEGRISTDGSTLAAYVIRTDEELPIARETLRLVSALRAPPPGPDEEH